MGLSFERWRDRASAMTLSQALSDGPNQIPLRDLGSLLEKLKRTHELSR
jgi:hypothetical protein